MNTSTNKQNTRRQLTEEEIQEYLKYNAPHDFTKEARDWIEKSVRAVELVY